MPNPRQLKLSSNYILVMPLDPPADDNLDLHAKGRFHCCNSHIIYRQKKQATRFSQILPLIQSNSLRFASTRHNILFCISCMSSLFTLISDRSNTTKPLVACRYKTLVDSSAVHLATEGKTIYSCNSFSFLYNSPPNISCYVSLYSSPWHVLPLSFIVLFGSTLHHCHCIGISP